MSLLQDHNVRPYDMHKNKIWSGPHDANPIYRFTQKRFHVIIISLRVLIIWTLFCNYLKKWKSETASYEAIVPFINMNYDGLKTAIIEMLSGSSVKVNTATFKNDTVNIQSKDDVLTYMIHLDFCSVLFQTWISFHFSFPPSLFYILILTVCILT